MVICAAARSGEWAQHFFKCFSFYGRLSMLASGARASSKATTASMKRLSGATAADQTRRAPSASSKRYSVRARSRSAPKPPPPRSRSTAGAASKPGTVGKAKRKVSVAGGTRKVRGSIAKRGGRAAAAKKPYYKRPITMARMTRARKDNRFKNFIKSLILGNIGKVALSSSPLAARFDDVTGWRFSVHAILKCG